MSLASRLRTFFSPVPEQRSGWPGDLLDVVNFGGYQYPIYGVNQTLGTKIEDIDAEYAGFVIRGYMGNPIVFALEMARMQLFTEARFQYQRLNSGRPGDLWGDASLGILEKPWPGGTTGDLLKYVMVDADFGGNSFTVRLDRTTLFRARPDWTTMVHGSRNPDAGMWDPGVEFLGIMHQPGGPASGKPPLFYQSSMVAHFAPIPDPFMPLRGMSWMTPIVREVMADQAMTNHRLQFFEHGATPSLVVKTSFPKLDDSAKEWIERFKADHAGTRNAYKTLFLNAGSDATVVGANLQQIEFKVTQGAGETRMAAAAGVPPVVAGLSEGLQGSSLNAGNFQASMRRFADLTMRPLWRNIAGSLERIVPPPGGSRLWYDDRDVPALKDDIKDAADVLNLQAQAINTLTTGGYDPETIIAAVTSGDLKRLKHTGLTSVQLKPPQDANAPEPVPQTMPMTPDQMPPANGQKPAVPAGGAT